MTALLSLFSGTSSTTLIILSGAVALFGLGVFGIWYAHHSGVKAGKASVELDVAKKDSSDATAMGKVMAEHRGDDDTAGRLRDGSF